MADRNYPLLPPKNWWVIRNRFKRSVPSSVSKNYLATVLGVSEKAAGNALPGLRMLGLVDDEGRTTDRANHWRVDTEYPEVCKQIMEEVYPEELLHAVPDPVEDYTTAVRWFMREAGVGQGTARAMARVYQLLHKADPSEGDDVTASKSKPKKEAKKSDPKPKAQKSASPNPTPPAIAPPPKPKGAPTLHIDVQVHISPDSSPEQIDTIFASMAKHLYKR
jgi:hypothetical protein